VFAFLYSFILCCFLRNKRWWWWWWWWWWWYSTLLLFSAMHVEQFQSRSICKPAFCLHHLLPPPRNTSAISRLRSSTPVHRPTSPTKSLNHCYSQNPVLCVSLNPRFIVSALSLLLCSTGELTPLSVDGWTTCTDSRPASPQSSSMFSDDASLTSAASLMSVNLSASAGWYAQRTLALCDVIL